MIKSIGQSLVSSNHEPQIEKKFDKYGEQYWQAYDFQTNRSHFFGSEQDVRIWIENRYHSF